jgi:hypothetical protein
MTLARLIHLGTFARALVTPDDSTGSFDCRDGQGGCVLDGMATSLLQSELQLTKPLHAETPNFVTGVESETPPLIFIKTHKTGSSTMRDMVMRVSAALNRSFMAPVDGTYLGWPGTFPGGDNLEAYGTGRHQFDDIAAHVIFNKIAMCTYIRGVPFIFTVIRRPIEQMGSAWSYYGGEKGYYPGLDESWPARIQFLQDAMPIHPNDWKRAEVGSLWEPSRFLNSQAHDLGWYRTIGNESFDQDDDTINTWLGDLEEQLDFAFTTEAFDEGLVLLGRRLGLTLPDLMYLRIRTTDDHTTRVDPSDDEVAKLEPFLHVDNLLYQRLNASFWRDWNQAGGYATLGDDLARLRSMNEELAKACPCEGCADTEFDDPCLLKHIQLARDAQAHNLLQAEFQPKMRRASSIFFR